MSEIRDRDDLILTVNRLMICAMEDIDSGRNEASPTTLDLVQRIEDCDAALRLALETATRERDEARRTVEALTPAANYCLEYKPLLLKAEYERDRAVRVLREIAAYGWYAKGAKVARAYFSAKEGR